ncbi:integral membrane protein [Cutibacterium acnes JCM 18916]|nr:integral membrane protein [Cutibacterium acnes JCM 18916]
MVATALSMVLMYVVVAIVFLARRGEKAAFQTFSKPATGTGNYIMASVTQGLEFGIAVAVILFGVRTILGELIPAFQGIASKVVPGAIPALDCPIVFPYAQNAVLIGFMSSFIGGLVGLTILATVLGPAWGLALILPGLVPHFFTGGAAGVYGNATGGRRGAVAGAFVNGLLVTFLPAFLLKVLGPFSSANTTFGDADFGWFGILIGYGARTGTVSGSIILALIGATILGSAILMQRRAGGWDPAPARGSSSDGVTAVVTAEEVSDDPDEATRTATASTISHRRIAPPVGAPTPPSRDELGL